MNSKCLTNKALARLFFLVNGMACAMMMATFAIAPGNCLASQQEVLTAESKVSIEVEIDKPEVLVAEPFQLEITATAPQGVTVKFPELEKRLGEFDVLSVSDVSDIPFGANRRWIRKVGLESLVAGEHEIPAIEVSYVDRRGATPVTGLESGPISSMTVRSTLEGTEDPTRFRDIKSVIFLPEPDRRNSHWVAWAAATAGFILVAVIAIALVRCKKALSPKQRAIKSLQELKISLANDDPDVEQAYIRLVSIFRIFVLEQFSISAPRLTTNEFLEAMQGDERLSDEFRAELWRLLNLVDMVKFAGLLPSSGGLDDVVDQSIQLVENSAKPSPTMNFREVSAGEDK